MFDYISNIRSHHTVPCTAEILHTVMRSTIVGQTCAEIADCHEQMLRGEMSREDFETKKTELKKRLPAFCFHAHFKNGRRLNAEAIASGLSILDIDHIGRHSEVGLSPALPVGEGEEQPKEQPKEQSKELSKESVTLMETLKRHLFTCTPITDEKTLATLKRLGIVLIHKTPSGEGLRLVFIIPQGMGLVEAQQWLSKQIGLEAFDEACKDLARCSFAVPEEYVLYCNEEEMFKEPQQPHPQPLSKGEGSDMLQDTPASTNNAPAITPAEHSQPHPRPLSNSLTPVSLSKGEGSDMLQDTPASTNNAPAKTLAEHSTPLSLGEGSGVRLLFVFDLCRE